MKVYFEIRKVFFLLFALAMALLVLVSACKENLHRVGKHIYRGQTTHQLVTFDLIKDEASDGHRTFVVRSCNNSEYFVCIEGEFVLAVRRGTLRVGEEWEYASTKFSVISIDENRGKRDYTIRVDGPYVTGLYMMFNEFDGIWEMRGIQNGEPFRAENNCGMGCFRLQ